MYHCRGVEEEEEADEEKVGEKKEKGFSLLALILHLKHLH